MGHQGQVREGADARHRGRRLDLAKWELRSRREGTTGRKKEKKERRMCATGKSAREGGPPSARRKSNRRPSILSFLLPAQLSPARFCLSSASRQVSRLPSLCPSPFFLPPIISPCLNSIQAPWIPNKHRLWPGPDLLPHGRSSVLCAQFSQRRREAATTTASTRRRSRLFLLDRSAVAGTPTPLSLHANRLALASSRPGRPAAAIRQEPSGERTTPSWPPSTKSGTQ